MLINSKIDFISTKHHRYNAFGILGRMRIKWSVGIGMVHPVHHRISTRTHIRCSLRDVSKNIKKSFPSFTHHKSAMSCIAMIKKGLRKKWQIPMRNEKNNYCSHVKNILKIGVVEKIVFLPLNHWMIIIYFVKFLNMLTFLLLQKSNKKRAPKTITPRFREAALMRHLCYCSLQFRSLIVGNLTFRSIFNCKTFYSNRQGSWHTKLANGPYATIIERQIDY